MAPFADRLCQAVKEKGTALCVGLDPRWEALPLDLQERHEGKTLDSAAAAVREFCLRVLERVTPSVGVIKPQSAFFEALGPAGMKVLQEVLNAGRERGLITILDSKRNDIASTATAYADAALDGTALGAKRLPVWNADALTINPYLGRDAVEPFLQSARRTGKGVFVLVRTSNPGAGLFQDLQSDGVPIYQHVARAVRSWTQENLGSAGFGDVGAVVGATYPAEMALLRRAMPEVIFLVPGFGAQGGTAADVVPAFRKDGLGAIVSSSRAIINSFNPGDKDWEAKIVDAVHEAIKQLKHALASDGGSKRG